MLDGLRAERVPVLPLPGRAGDGLDEGDSEGAGADGGIESSERECLLQAATATRQHASYDRLRDGVGGPRRGVVAAAQTALSAAGGEVLAEAGQPLRGESGRGLAFGAVPCSLGGPGE